jgi:7-keto-8-aminopelargonate synthetase-like enzyme
MNKGGRTRLQQGEKLFLNQLVSNRLNAAPATEGALTFQAHPGATARDWTDYGSLPHFRELKQQRSLADLIGLQNPFFRVHDTAAGATTIINGRTLINFSSYDYLGFNQHPEVRSAAYAAVETFGTSSSASRLVAGERPLHQKLETALANHYGYEHCVVYVSGHATNVATISTLLGPRDLILHDQFGHNSTVTGAVLSRAERRAFPHNDFSRARRDAGVKPQSI